MMEKWTMHRKLRYTLVIAILVMLTAMAIPNTVIANGITVSRVRMTARDTSAGPNNPANFTFIRFNLSWENAWRFNFSNGINNHDAAWVFVKFRIPGGNWQHAYLNNTGHDAGTWGGQGPGPALIEAGLQDPAVAFNASTNPAMGVFISNGAINLEPGPFEATNVRLRWNYGAQGIDDNALIEIRVYALEMVFVPQGAFFVGSGSTENGGFTNGSWTSGVTLPLRIAGEGALTIGNASGNLWGRSSSGDSTIGSAGTLPASYPKGYNGYYAMKYEITQQQWIDFFNTLNATQKANRDITGSSGKNNDAITNRNNISWTSGDASLNGGTHGEIACNYLSWSDVLAYLDFAALRPLTELEFEKAARGEREGVEDEYAWGNDLITVNPYTLGNAGSDSELVATGYSNASVGGNAWYAATQSGNGPTRAGIFAADTAGTGRSTAGAGRYGQLEVSGNVWERTVNVATTSGRAYDGRHGDGLLNSAGSANVTNWPGANGGGFRAGSWLTTAGLLRLADRSRAALDDSTRASDYGGRGGRSRPCTVPAVTPAVITDSVLVNFDNVLLLRTSGAGGGEGYNWVVPPDWRIISGQGSANLYVTRGSLPATIYVSVVNQCGAGTARTRTFTP